MPGSSQTPVIVFFSYLKLVFPHDQKQNVDWSLTKEMRLEVFERFCFLASLPLAITRQREGGEKTQPCKHL